jgi:hypothetical protein
MIDFKLRTMNAGVLQLFGPGGDRLAPIIAPPDIEQSREQAFITGAVEIVRLRPSGQVLARAFPSIARTA